MAKDKRNSRSGRKHKPFTGRAGHPLIRKLPVPESSIRAMREEYGHALMRFFFGTASLRDRNRLFSVCIITERLLNGFEDDGGIRLMLERARSSLADPDVVPDCELLRAVVETSEEMWRQSTVEEFVSSASTFNANDIPFPEEEPD